MQAAAPAERLGQDPPVGIRKEEMEHSKPAAVGSPSSGGNRSANTTWFGRAGPICILPTPFAAASGSTGADGTGTLTQQGSLNTGSDDDGTSAGRDATSGSSTDTPDDAQTQGGDDDDKPSDPVGAAAAAVVARLKRKISARPSAPMGPEAAAAADAVLQRGATPAALFDPQLVPGAAAAQLDANAPAGSTALGGGSDPAVVKSMAAAAATQAEPPAAVADVKMEPTEAAVAAPAPEAAVGGSVKEEPPAADAGHQPATSQPVSDGNNTEGTLATLSTSSKSGKEARRTVRARRSAETLEQMSARMEAMATQQAALEAHVVKISSEKEHLIQQVHVMREKLAAAAAEASRLQRLRTEQNAHQQAAMLQASQQQQQPAQQAQQQQLQAARAMQQAAASQAPPSVFTGVQTFNQPISTGVPGAPPPHSISISVTRPGITVTSSSSRPPQGQNVASAVAAGQLVQAQQPRLGMPGVGPGPSGGSGPAYFMMQQQQQHQHQQQQHPRLGVPGMGPGPSGGSGSGYATLGYGLGSAVYPGPPLRQRAGQAAGGQQQRPAHFQGPGAGEGLAYPPGSAGLMSMSNPYGQQVFGQQLGPPQLVRTSAPGPFITTTGGGGPPVTSTGPPNLGRYSAPGGAAAMALIPAQQQRDQEQAQSLAQGRTRRQPTRAAATKAAAIVATATTRPNGLPATAANVAAALHDLAPAPAAAVLPAGQLTNGGMGSAVADPLDFLLTQMSLSLDELELPELPSL